jgi:6-phosphofructokinase 1
MIPAYPEQSVAVLFSGGDAPGMNAFLRAIVRLGLNREKIAVLGIRDGYRGLVRTARAINGDAEALVRLKKDIASHTGRAGLISEQLHIIQMDHASLNVRALVVVGGDGSLTGAKLLADESDLRVIGIPATIDNDLQFTDMALGVDTAVHTLVWAVDHFIDTARSHRRVMVLETMGRESGDLARMAGLASGAEMIITPEPGPLNEEAMKRLAAKIEGAMTRGRGHAIVLVAEGVKFDPPQKRNRAYVLMDAFQQYFQRPGAPFPDLEVRPSVLGHLQRGGHTTPQDCILAARFADCAWKCIQNPDGGSGITALRKNVVEIVPYGSPDMPERAEFSREMDQLHDDLSSW